MAKEIKLSEEEKKKLFEGVRKASEKYLFGSRNPHSKKNSSKK